MSSYSDSPTFRLADSDSTKFVLRWRGTQEGPYLASVIEAKLAANEIGLLHQILHNGRWISIRDYLAERQALCDAEGARLKTERLAREEADRKSSERQQQQRDELRAEEKRNRTLVEHLGRGEREPSSLTGALTHITPRWISVAAVLIAGMAIYGIIWKRIEADRATAEAVRIQAEQQAGSVKAAAKAQEKAAAMNAAASIINTVINGAVEANRPAPVIIQNE